MEGLIWTISGMIMYLLMYIVTRNLYDTEYGIVYKEDYKIKFPRIIYFIMFLIMLVPVINISIFIVLLIIWLFKLSCGDIGYNSESPNKIMKFFSEKI